MKDKQKLVLASLVVILLISQGLLFINQIKSRDHVQTHPTHSTLLSEGLISPQESARNLEAVSIKLLSANLAGSYRQQQDRLDSLFQKRFGLILIFNEIGCSDCIWKALYSLNNHLEDIQRLGGSVIAIADSGAFEEVQRLSKAISMNFSVVFVSNTFALFPGNFEWKPPVMLLVDGDLNRIVYARYEDGFDIKREAFIEKALRLYKFPEMSDSTMQSGGQPLRKQLRHKTHDFPITIPYLLSQQLILANNNQTTNHHAHRPFHNPAAGPPTESGCFFSHVSCPAWCRSRVPTIQRFFERYLFNNFYCLFLT